ncbi:hypothetical protein [Allosphingosinicella deserti]|uniref:Uncharacterized protein n=1 Tax=Allosphingosinicella deserti TaxID=2116704 RepID=A0A2P7QLU7_9SPHN|nr:hypothetical protein [Sphingomonas deserti]PSJ38937.1 hypothetical protein C7I55_16615 [Sphingomonas deserti]
MKSRYLSAIVASALVLAPTATLAQSAAPAPAVETVSADEGSNLLGGGGMVLAGVFFAALLALILLEDEIFGDDGPLNPGTPVTP